jgi:predicted O-methyltransferase YrrM
MANVDLQALLQDPKLVGVLERCYAEWKGQRGRLVPRFLPLLPKLLLRRRLEWGEAMLERTRDMYLPLEPEQGALLYLSTRALGARRIVEFGTSFGVSTLFFAAAVRDNGGGTVIGTEIVPEKAEVARRHFAEAGLAEFIDLRVGDARDSLNDCGGPVDVLLLDGFKDIELDVLRAVQPQLRAGALVFTDNIRTFYADNEAARTYVAEPKNGFRAAVLPFKDGLQMAVYTG